MARIELSQLVPKEQFERVIAREQAGDITTTTTVRGVTLCYLTQSQRQLWQAVGHEYIEPELLDFIDGLPAHSVYYDIGASNGIFAHYAAAKGLQVYAFEADAQNFSLLDYNNFLNGGGVHCFNLALSDTLELGKLYAAKFETAGHMKILDRPQYVGGGDFTPEYVSTVQKYPLDTWIATFKAPPPAFIKIDVDGAEYDVLRGAQATLKQVQGVFIELSDTTESTPAIIQLLEQSGLVLAQKKQVQHYTGLHNCIFLRK